ITKITTLTRRPLPEWLEDGLPESGLRKMESIVLEDFLNYAPSIHQQLSSHDACIWAIGASSIGKSEKDYTTITYDYIVRIVAALESSAHQRDAPMKFVFISGTGAELGPEGQAPKKMFGRIKRQAEQYLLGLPTGSKIDAIIIRPGYFFPTYHSYIRPTRPLLSRMAHIVLKPILANFLVSQWSLIEDLSHFTIEAARGYWGQDRREVDNMPMKKLLAAQLNLSTSLPHPNSSVNLVSQGTMCVTRL
ncbi:hypothetical protein F5051DRAFT_341413, partial [Lentinula edodes]